MARAALDAGAGLVNDVTALRGDPAMAALVAERGCPVCLMHMLGEPRTMQDDPRYDDVVGEVIAFLEERLAAAVAAGVREEQVLLDPGIGFGKTLEHNLLLLRHLDRIAALGRPVVLGASRKRFIGALLGAAPRERVSGHRGHDRARPARAGAAVVRVHDVRAQRRGAARAERSSRPAASPAAVAPVGRDAGAATPAASGASRERRSQ